jgi:hypothetical protein
VHDQGWRPDLGQEIDDIRVGGETENALRHFRRGSNPLQLVKTPEVLDGPVRNELRRKELPVGILVAAPPFAESVCAAIPAAFCLFPGCLDATNRGQIPHR